MRTLHRSPLWFFAHYKRPFPKFGNHDGSGTLTWLFGIIIGQGAGFAASVKQEGLPIVAIVGYGIIVVLTMIGIAIIINTLDGSHFYHNRLTINLGICLQIFSLVYAGGFILASIEGWLPGQTGSKSLFLDDQIPCDVRLAKSATGLTNVALTGQNDPRQLVDEYVLNTLQRWLQTTNNIEGKQRQILMARQITPFKENYQSFDATINLRFATDGSVDFVDALAFIGRGVKGDEANDPIMRLLVSSQNLKAAESKAYANPQNVPDREYQQIPLPIIQQGKFLPVIHIKNPNKGDSLIMFVLVKAADKTTLSDDTGWFDFKLEKVR